MKSVILLAAALAAGLSSFAADAANSDRTEPFRPKAQNIQKTTGLKVESSQHSDRQNRSVAAVTAKKKAAAPKKSEKSATSAAKAAASKFAKSSKEASRMKKPPVTRKTTKRGPKNTAKIDITTTASINTSGWGRAYGEIVSRYAAAYGVPASLAHAVIRVESNYRPNARGSAGEIGLMQIKPSTARMMGYSGSTSGLFNPETNIKYGLKYLAKARQLGGGSTCGTILRYNAGHGATRMNPVSAAYCAKVKRQLAG
jgi:soluble lytic murein transglycosylase-like protein